MADATVATAAPTAAPTQTQAPIEKQTSSATKPPGEGSATATSIPGGGSSTSTEDSGPPKISLKDEIRAALDGLTPEEAREASAMLLKKNPIKAKYKHTEQNVDDWNAIQSIVGQKYSIGKEREALAQQREEIAQQQAMVQAFVSGDQQTIAELFEANPKVAKASLDYLTQQYQREQELSQLPEGERRARLEAEQYKQKLTAFERQQMEQRQQFEQQREAQQDTQVRNEVNQWTLQALQAAGVSEKTAPQMLRRITPLMARNIKAGLPIVPEELAVELRDGLNSEWQDMYESTPDDQLLTTFGDKIGARFARAWLNKMRGPGQQPQAQQAVQQRQDTKPEPRPGDPGYWEHIKRLAPSSW